MKLLKIGKAVFIVVTSTVVNNAVFAQPLVGINYKIKQLESSFNGRIGIYAIDTNNTQVISYRDNERFPVQSTMKMIGVAALLKLSESQANLLQEKIHYTKNELIDYSPVTHHYSNSGMMTLGDLGEASVTYSDGAAINLIMKKFGGPKFTVDFARSIGNNSYNVTHYEGDLNSNPKNSDDTATPKDMAISVQKLIVDDALATPQKQQLLTWMRNTVTSYKLMRAGIPIGFAVADKSGGSGDYGTRNDIGIIPITI